MKHDYESNELAKRLVDMTRVILRAEGRGFKYYKVPYRGITADSTCYPYIAPTNISSTEEYSLTMWYMEDEILVIDTPMSQPTVAFTVEGINSTEWVLLLAQLYKNAKAFLSNLENFEKNKKITIDEKVKEINKIFGDLL